MSNIPAALEVKLAQFEARYPSQGPALRAIVNASPQLQSFLTSAITLGHLDGGFSALRNSLEGFYKPGTETISVRLDKLEQSKTDATVANALLMTLGHEVHHALTKNVIVAEHRRFISHIHEVANGPSPHDYTGVMAQAMSAGRAREAIDEIGGVNMLASKVRGENPGATQQELFDKLYAAAPNEMSPYMDTIERSVNGRITEAYQPKPGIEFNNQFQIVVSPVSIEAFGKFFFDALLYPADYFHDRITTIQAIHNNGNRSSKANRSPAYIDLEALGIKDQVNLPAGMIDKSTLAPSGRDGHAPAHSMVMPSERITRLLLDSENSIRIKAAPYKPHVDVSSAEMRNIVAAVAQAAHAKGMSTITHLHWDAQRIRLLEFNGVGIIEAEVLTHEAARTPEAQSRQRMAQADMRMQVNEYSYAAQEPQESQRIGYDTLALARSR